MEVELPEAIFPSRAKWLCLAFDTTRNFVIYSPVITRRSHCIAVLLYVTIDSMTTYFMSIASRCGGSSVRTGYERGFEVSSLKDCTAARGRMRT